MCSTDLTADEAGSDVEAANNWFVCRVLLQSLFQTQCLLECSRMEKYEQASILKASEIKRR